MRPRNDIVLRAPACRRVAHLSISTPQWRGQNRSPIAPLGPPVQAILPTLRMKS